MNKHIQNLKDTLNSKVVNPQEGVHVLLLTDSSGSVSFENFELVKIFIQGIIKRTDFFRVSLSFGQFSSGCQLQSTFTNDKTKLLKNLEEMRKNGGETNLFGAIEVVHNIFSVIKSSKKYFILITDEIPDNDYELTSEINKLVRKDVNIISIGINIPQKNRFQEIFSSGTPILLEKYEHLNDTLTKVSTENKLIGLSVKLKEDLISPMEPLDIEIVVNNTSEIEIQKNSILEIDGGELYGKHSKILKERIMTEELNLTQRLESKSQNFFDPINYLPDVLSVKLFPPNDNKIPITSSSLKVQMHHFVKDLKNWKPLNSFYPKANIIFFGPSGSGKSTLINSLISLFSENFEAPANSLSLQTRVTQRLTSYQTPGEFLFYDTAGWSTMTPLLDSEIDSLLKGKLPLGYNFITKNTGVSLSPGNETANEEFKPHCCVFVVDYTFGFHQDNSKSTIMETFNKMKDETIKHGVHFVVVVTKIDQIPKGLSLDQVKEEIFKTVGTSRSSIYLIDNSEPEKKNLSQQKVLYLLLSKILNISSNWMTTDWENGLTDHRQKVQPSQSEPSNIESSSTILECLAIKEVNGNKIVGIISKRTIIDDMGLHQLRMLISESFQEPFEFVNTQTDETIKMSEENGYSAQTSIQVMQSIPYVLIRVKPPEYSRE